jgi:hypothetical protein
VGLQQALQLLLHARHGHFLFLVPKKKIRTRVNDGEFGSEVQETQ